MSNYLRATFFGLAAISLIAGVWSSMQCIPLAKDASWIKTDAAIVKAEIVDTVQSLEFKIAYKYRAGDKIVSTTGTLPIYLPEDKFDEQQKLVERKKLEELRKTLEKSRNFAVYYNPANTAESRPVSIDPFPLVQFVVLTIGCFLVFVFAALKLIFSTRRGA